MRHTARERAIAIEPDDSNVSILEMLSNLYYGSISIASRAFRPAASLLSRVTGYFRTESDDYTGTLEGIRERAKEAPPPVNVLRAATNIATVVSEPETEEPVVQLIEELPRPAYLEGVVAPGIVMPDLVVEEEKPRTATEIYVDGMQMSDGLVARTSDPVKWIYAEYKDELVGEVERTPGMSDAAFLAEKRQAGMDAYRNLQRIHRERMERKTCQTFVGNLEDNGLTEKESIKATALEMGYSTDKTRRIVRQIAA